MAIEQFVLAWSQRQNAFHVEPLAQHIASNKAAPADDRAGEYRLIAVGSREEVERAADALRPAITSRDVIRRAADRGMA